MRNFPLVVRVIAASAIGAFILTTATAAPFDLAQGRQQSAPGGNTDAMAKIAREYVRLVLAMGQHDKDYVDAYYGPEDLKKEAEGAKLTLDDIGAGVKALQTQVAGVSMSADELWRLRHQYLDKQLSAMSARVRMLKGERLSFDEESKALYDAVAPTYPEAHFQDVLDRLEKRFPAPARSSSATTRGGARS